MRLELFGCQSAWRCLSAGCIVFFFFNDTATTEIYTLSLHDALPICFEYRNAEAFVEGWLHEQARALVQRARSEEHTSELQSRSDIVCRLLLEKKKKPSSRRPSCSRPSWHPHMRRPAHLARSSYCLRH